MPSIRKDVSSGRQTGTHVVRQSILLVNPLGWSLVCACECVCVCACVCACVCISVCRSARKECSLDECSLSPPGRLRRGTEMMLQGWRASFIAWACIFLAFVWTKVRRRSWQA